MSFSIEFNAASKADAATLIDQGSVPDTISTFLKIALQGVKEDAPVYVKANGHLCIGGTGDYNVSSATIEVRPLVFQTPRVPKTV